MKKKGRKELIVRQCRDRGNIFFVGFWDGNTGDPLRDFRCVGIRHSEEDAKKLRLDLIVRESHKYY